ncbi:hypothetical protein GEMRC1_010286 [Eukaryota sp. GEM-RC1]
MTIPTPTPTLSVDNLRSRIDRLKVVSETPFSSSSLSLTSSSPSPYFPIPDDADLPSAWLSIVNSIPSNYTKLQVYTSAFEHLSQNPNYHDYDFIRLLLDFVRLKSTFDKPEAISIISTHEPRFPDSIRTHFNSDIQSLKIFLSLNSRPPVTPAKRLASYATGTPSTLNSTGSSHFLRRRKRRPKLGPPGKEDELGNDALSLSDHEDDHGKESTVPTNISNNSNNSISSIRDSVQESVQESLDVSHTQPYHSPFSTPVKPKPKVITQKGGKGKVRFADEATRQRKSLEVNGESYEVLGQVGKGGTSRVFKALDTNNTLVALKVIQFDKNDPNTRSMLLNEFKYLKLLNNTDLIINLIDHQVDDDHMILVLEYGETDLNTVLRRETQQGFISINFIRMYFERMLKSVQVIHEHRIVHGDLKPANFMLVSGQLKLIDFGINWFIEEFYSVGEEILST